MVVPAPDLASLRNPGMKWFARRGAAVGLLSFAVPIGIYFFHVKPKFQRYDEFFK